jgi:hypothetical protein
LDTSSRLMRFDIARPSSQHDQRPPRGGFEHIVQGKDHSTDPRT